MSLIDLLLKRKKQHDEALNVEGDMEETAEQKKERLAKAMEKSSDTFRSR